MKVLLRILPFVVGAVGHVQLISPMTRNTVDRNLPQWKGGRFGNDNCNRTAWQYTCCTRPGKQTALAYVRTRLHCCWDGSTDSILLAAHAGAGGGNCHNGTHICDVGQNFLWFTQGTSIGCAAPDGHLGNNRSEQGNDRDRCGSGMKPTNNDPRFRTFNRDVPAMSAQDRYVSSLGQSGPSRTVLPGGVCSFD